jgi:hypothetical protein
MDILGHILLLLSDSLTIFCIFFIFRFVYYKLLIFIKIFLTIISDILTFTNKIKIQGINNLITLYQS